MAKPMEELREAPLGRINATAPIDRGELLAVRDRGDFRGFGFGAVIAPQIIVIERLEIFADGNDGGASGVQGEGENLIGGNPGFPDDLAGSRRQGAHVIFMRLGGVFGIFAFAVERIL